MVSLGYSTTVGALLFVLQGALIWTVLAPLLANFTPPVLDPIDDPGFAWVIRPGCPFELFREWFPVGVVPLALSFLLPECRRKLLPTNIVLIV